MNYRTDADLVLRMDRLAGGGVGRSVPAGRTGSTYPSSAGFGRRSPGPTMQTLIRALCSTCWLTRSTSSRSRSTSDDVERIRVVPTSTQRPGARPEARSQTSRTVIKAAKAGQWTANDDGSVDREPITPCIGDEFDLGARSRSTVLPRRRSAARQSTPSSFSTPTVTPEPGGRGPRPRPRTPRSAGSARTATCRSPTASSYGWAYRRALEGTRSSGHLDWIKGQVLATSLDSRGADDNLAVTGRRSAIDDRQLRLRPGVETSFELIGRRSGRDYLAAAEPATTAVDLGTLSSRRTVGDGIRSSAPSWWETRRNLRRPNGSPAAAG